MRARFHRLPDRRAFLHRQEHRRGRVGGDRDLQPELTVGAIPADLDRTVDGLVRGFDPGQVAGRLRPGVPVEPLVLRAAAGDCVEVELTNALDPDLLVVKGDLTATVKSALRTLVASKEVVDEDGMYSLPPRT